MSPNFAAESLDLTFYGSPRSGTCRPFKLTFQFIKPFLRLSLIAHMLIVLFGALRAPGRFVCRLVEHISDESTQPDTGCRTDRGTNDRSSDRTCAGQNNSSDLSSENGSSTAGTQPERIRVRETPIIG
jgi:hypothetical protein